MKEIGISREERLQLFVDWCGHHITGDEKGQAQLYLDRLFQAFGQKGTLEVGGSPEMRIKKATEDGGGTSFADYVWKPVVLIEMKKRGVDLRKHYKQAFDYWVRLVPDRPRFVVLCNFDAFYVYDFDRQIDEPLDIVKLADLPKRWGPLAFLFPTNEKPTFDNDRTEVTREAADNLARCFNLLTHRSRPGGTIAPDLAQRFVLQALVALFAEDIDLLPKYLVAGLLDESTSPAKAFDLIGGLFDAMNARSNAGGRYKGVKYFNGGLFREPAKIELNDAEIFQLREAAKSDWSKVSPDIFGTLFEHSLGKEDRHAFGAHYTNPLDIMKIVGPTIIDPWTEAIRAAQSGKALTTLLDRLTTLKVLDPACGSGNFLYIAYRAMKRLEALIRERLTAEFPNEQPRLIHVNARQFFGMDVKEFAVELAKVSMMIGRKLAIDELHIIDEPPLPLDNLDKNFLCVDALMSYPSTSHAPSPGTPGGQQAVAGRGEGLSPADDINGGRQSPAAAGTEGTDESVTGVTPSRKTPFGRTPWPEAHVIIGNPPFLGAKRLKPERGADYVNALRKLYPEVPGMADYCVYWIARANEHLPPCTKTDPFAGRAGLVGTQNIRNNRSRVGGLDRVVATGTIIEAVDNQPWSGEANVHVSIANWIKTQDAALVPKTKRLWSKVEPAKGGKKVAKRGVRADKTFELKDRKCDAINPALSDQTDVTAAAKLEANTEPQVVYQGQVPGHEAFVLDNETAAEMIRKRAKNRGVIHPFLIGRDVLTGDGSPTRWVIDFQAIDQLQASQYVEPFRRIQEDVLPGRVLKAEEGQTSEGVKRSHHQLFLRYWWRQSYDRSEMISKIDKLSRYIVCSGVTKRPIFNFYDRDIRPDHAVFVFLFNDDYSFGLLSSSSHWLWFITKCSKLKSDYRYTPPTVFDTFPWPQSPTKAQIDAVAEAGREVRRVRGEALKVIDGGLRAVYRTLELPGKHPLKDAHADLDAAVLTAYGFGPKKDLLQQLLDLNHEVAAREKAGEAVTAPGVPASYGDTKKLITDDCIRPRDD